MKKLERDIFIMIAISIILQMIILVKVFTNAKSLSDIDSNLGRLELVE